MSEESEVEVTVLRVGTQQGGSSKSESCNGASKVALASLVLMAE